MLSSIKLESLAPKGITAQITGSRKQSDEERGAALFAVRVHLHCYAIL